MSSDSSKTDPAKADQLVLWREAVLSDRKWALACYKRFQGGAAAKDPSNDQIATSLLSLAAENSITWCLPQDVKRVYDPYQSDDRKLVNRALLHKTELQEPYDPDGDVMYD